MKAYLLLALVSFVTALVPFLTSNNRVPSSQHFGVCDNRDLEPADLNDFGTESYKILRRELLRKRLPNAWISSIQGEDFEERPMYVKPYHHGLKVVVFLHENRRVRKLKLLTACQAPTPESSEAEDPDAQTKIPVTRPRSPPESQNSRNSGQLPSQPPSESKPSQLGLAPATSQPVSPPPSQPTSSQQPSQPLASPPQQHPQPLPLSSQQPSQALPASSQQSSHSQPESLHPPVEPPVNSNESSSIPEPNRKSTKTSEISREEEEKFVNNEVAKSLEQNQEHRTQEDEDIDEETYSEIEGDSSTTDEEVEEYEDPITEEETNDFNSGADEESKEESLLHNPLFRRPSKKVTFAENVKNNEKKRFNLTTSKRMLPSIVLTDPAGENKTSTMPKIESSIPNTPRPDFPKGEASKSNSDDKNAIDNNVLINNSGDSSNSDITSPSPLLSTQTLDYLSHNSETNDESEHDSNSISSTAESEEQTASDQTLPPLTERKR